MKGKFRVERGFTLIELMIALAVLGLLSAALGTAIYQFWTVTRLQQATVKLSAQLQQAASLLNRDVVSAAGGTAGNPLVLQIPEYVFGSLGEPITHTVTYVHDPDAQLLTRQEDGGNPIIVARYIVSMTVEPPGPIISTTEEITITMTAALDVPESSRTMQLVLSRRPPGGGQDQQGEGSDTPTPTSTLPLPASPTPLPSATPSPTATGTFTPLPTATLTPTLLSLIHI